jgi:hypothetical protein
MFEGSSSRKISFEGSGRLNSRRRTSEGTWQVCELNSRGLRCCISSRALEGGLLGVGVTTQADVEGDIWENVVNSGEFKAIKSGLARCEFQARNFAEQDETRHRARWTRMNKAFTLQGHLGSVNT